MSMRLFLAALPPSQTKEKLCQAAFRLEKGCRKGKFARWENLHLTFAFIGETERVDGVKRAIDRIEARPFEVEVRGLGRFCGRGGDVCWAGVAESEELGRLQEAAVQELRREDFSLEERPYRPHLTLARGVAFTDGVDADALLSSIALETRFTAEKISLMKSHQTGGRLVYTEIYEKRF